MTLGHALANLLTVSDDTAVRLCGLVARAAEINAILRRQGFPEHPGQPVANPNRFFLGTSTPGETHDLLRALVGGTLLSPASTAFCSGTCAPRGVHRRGPARMCPRSSGPGSPRRPAGSPTPGTRPG